MSETTSIRIYQDAGLLDVAAIMPWIMATIVVAVGVVGLLVSGVTPVSIAMAAPDGRLWSLWAGWIMGVHATMWWGVCFPYLIDSAEQR